jgi:putative transposase
MEQISRTKEEIEEEVVFVRLELYNRGLSCGPASIRKKMEEYGEVKIPSERTISRIMARQGLTYQRTGWYEGDEQLG